MGAVQDQTQAASQQQQPPKVAERLNPAVQQQLNLESVKTRAISLFKAISRILEDFDVISRSNAVPKWSNLSLFFFSLCCSSISCFIIIYDSSISSNLGFSLIVAQIIHEIGDITFLTYSLIGFFCCCGSDMLVNGGKSVIISTSNNSEINFIQLL